MVGTEAGKMALNFVKQQGEEGEVEESEGQVSDLCLGAKVVIRILIPDDHHRERPESRHFTEYSR